MFEAKGERIEVIVIKDFPKPHGREFISIYESESGHTTLKTSSKELTDHLVVTLRGSNVNMFAEQIDSIVVPTKYYHSRIKPPIMARYNCYSSSEIPSPVVSSAPIKIVPEYSKNSIQMPDDGLKVTFNYSPSKIIPRRRATLTIGYGDDTITIPATKTDLKHFIVGLKDCIRLILNIER